MKTLPLLKRAFDNGITYTILVLILLPFLLVFLWYIGASQNGLESEWKRVLVDDVLYWSSWVALIPLIVVFNRFFVKQNNKFFLVLYLVLGLISSFVHRFITITLWWSLVPDSFDPKVYSLGEAYATRLFRDLHLSFIVYLILIFCINMIAYYKKFQAEEKKAALLEVQLVHAQLEALKMRLQPHFLFNVLNSISGLLREDVEAADRMIAKLGELLRITLKSSDIQFVSLREEINYVNIYLDIERLRLQERLARSINIDDDCNRATIPVFILQPIVENAVKHGIAKRKEGGTIAIKAYSRNDNLVIEVVNESVDSHDSYASGGFGLSNTKKRLDEIYGTKWQLDINQSDGGNTTVSLKIPLKPLDPTLSI